MMQLDLIPRRMSRPAHESVHVPDWLDLCQQLDLLTQVRQWTKGGFYTPRMPDGTPMNHPLCGLGLLWEPYRYLESDRPMPPELVELAKRAVKETLPKLNLSEFEPDVCIVNLFPPGSSLGMHQDRSEDEDLRNAGNPIVTISLGCTAMFRMGNRINPGPPYSSIEVRSGDLIVMAGHSRMNYHGIFNVQTDTDSPALGMEKSVRLSLTIRQARRKTV